MNERLEGPELAALVRRVFIPRPGEESLAILVDLPDAQVADNAAWKERREMAADWARELSASDLGLQVRLVLFRNAHTNNGELPPGCWTHAGALLPACAEDLDPAAAKPFAELFAAHPILLAPTEFSATAPLKMAAKSHPIRAATMPGFGPAMIPALRLDYTEIDRRVRRLNGRNLPLCAVPSPARPGGYRPRGRTAGHCRHPRAELLALLPGAQAPGERTLCARRRPLLRSGIRPLRGPQLPAQVHHDVHVLLQS